MYSGSTSIVRRVPSLTDDELHYSLYVCEGASTDDKQHSATDLSETWTWPRHS